MLKFCLETLVNLQKKDTLDTEMSLSTKMTPSAAKRNDTSALNTTDIGVSREINFCRMSISCNTYSMQVSINQKDLADVSLDTIKLNSSSPKCHPSHNGSHFNFDVPLFECGTIRRYLSSAVVYTNAVCFVFILFVVYVFYLIFCIVAKPFSFFIYFFLLTSRCI